jgi:hypothetical protein
VTPPKRRGWRVVFGLAVVAPLLSGCQLLFPGINPPDPDAGEFFPDASPVAEFITGRGTIEIADGPTIELKQLHGEAELYKLLGATLTWEGPDGWYLRLAGVGTDSPDEAFSKYLTLERIVSGEHWTTKDPTRCVIDIDKADKTGVKGSATCKGLQWHDALAGYDFGNDDEDLVPDQPKFDATVTFEAEPE